MLPLSEVATTRQSSPSSLFASKVQLTHEVFLRLHHRPRVVKASTFRKPTVAHAHVARVHVRRRRRFRRSRLVLSTFSRYTTRDIFPNATASTTKTAHYPRRRIVPDLSPRLSRWFREGGGLGTLIYYRMTKYSTLLTVSCRKRFCGRWLAVFPLSRGPGFRRA